MEKNKGEEWWKNSIRASSRFWIRLKLAFLPQRYWERVKVHSAWMDSNSGPVMVGALIKEHGIWWYEGLLANGSVISWMEKDLTRNCLLFPIEQAEKEH